MCVYINLCICTSSSPHSCWHLARLLMQRSRPQPAGRRRGADGCADKQPTGQTVAAQLEMPGPKGRDQGPGDGPKGPSYRDMSKDTHKHKCCRNYDLGG